MFLTTMMTAAVALGGDRPGPDVLSITAAMPETLEVGQEAEIAFELEVADGWSVATAGIPKAFVQIDVPDSVTLAGKVLSTHRELARAEFLQMPFERWIDPGSSPIGFTLDESPADGETIALNVIAYVREGDAGEARFVRRRYELPLEAGAAATSVDPANTTWSSETHHVGDTADPFSLPRADGTKVELETLLKDKHVLVTTYRAFW